MTISAKVSAALVLLGCSDGAAFIETPPDTDAGPDTASPVDASSSPDAADTGSAVDSGATSYAKAWAFGDNATRLYFDGSAWSIDSSQPAPDGGKRTDYLAAWRGPSSLWAVGSSFLVSRYQGGSWSSLPSPQGVGLDGGSPNSDNGALAGVWGSAENDVWVIESDPFPNSRPFLHWDGSTWTRSEEVVSADLSAIYGVAANDIWVAGNKGVTTTLVLYHYDGSHWNLTTAPVDNTLGDPGLIGFAGNDFWLASLKTFYRWDGMSWTPSLSMVGGGTSFFGLSDADLWGVGSGNTLHYDGSTWKPSPTKVIAGVTALGGVTTGDMWAVGQQGAAAHYDGSSWTAYPTGTTGALHAVLGVPRASTP